MNPDQEIEWLPSGKIGIQKEIVRMIQAIFTLNFSRPSSPFPAATACLFPSRKFG